MTINMGMLATIKLIVGGLLVSEQPGGNYISESFRLV
jgi:hypothetical protein